ncbi:MAG: type II secretion system F family protein [Bacillota bacterium]
MSPTLLTLLISLSTALATWTIAHTVITFLHGDREKLQHRLASDWRGNSNEILNRSATLRPELQGLPDFLARHAFIQNLNHRLIQAYPEANLLYFLIITASIAILLFALVAVLLQSIFVGLLVGAAALYFPILVINRKRARRQKLLTEQLPDALEFLTRVLKAGHSLSTGIQMMGDELPQPIGYEFRRCYDQHSLGQSLEESLRDMVTRIESSDFSFFVTAILIQRQTGGDLSEVLTNISAVIRSRLCLQDHVKSVTAEGRLTGTILVIFPIALFVLSYALNPEYAGLLLNTDTGRFLLFLAAAMQIVGFFAIRRIVAIKP